MNVQSYTSKPFIALYLIQYSVSFILHIQAFCDSTCTINPSVSILYHHINVQKACYRLFMYRGCLCSDVGTVA